MQINADEYRELFEDELFIFTKHMNYQPSEFMKMPIWRKRSQLKRLFEFNQKMKEQFSDLDNKVQTTNTSR